MGTPGRVLLVALCAAAALAAAAPASADVRIVDNRYLVVLRGNSEAAKGLLLANGGVVVHDLSKQIGVLVVDSTDPAFLSAVRVSPLVDDAAHDFAVKALPSADELGGPQPHADPLEPLQWSMRQIRAPEAHAVQAGSREVEVAVIDTGIDGSHPDFVGADGSNVDCLRGFNFVTGLGDPDPCRDNQFHGTHVAGLIGARANGVGIVGSAPNVTLIPLKACDTLGFCFSSATVAAETFAGDLRVEVMNMSYSVNGLQADQPEFLCNNDPIERTFRKANERAIRYAIKQGVLPVASLGNRDVDLAHPPEPFETWCEVVA